MYIYIYKYIECILYRIYYSIIHIIQYRIIEYYIIIYSIIHYRIIA